MENTESVVREIEETDLNSEDSPLIPERKNVRTKVPEVEVHMYRQGKGPIAVFKSSLGGWEQDQLEVREILEKYGFKSLYAFNVGSGRGVPIRFNPKNGRSMLTYRDGSVIYVDGEPKPNSWGFDDQSRDKDTVWGDHDNHFDSSGFEGISRLAEETKHNGWKHPSLGSCLHCYSFYSNEEKNQELVAEIWLVKIDLHSSHCRFCRNKEIPDR